MSGQLDRFNWIAPYYDGITNLIFGKSIWKSQTCHLGLIPVGANVLVLGGGTGKWLSELLTLNGTCRIWYIEASSKMLSLAKSNLNNSAQVTFVHGTEKDIPAIQFSAIITHFYLDMFTNQQMERLLDLVDQKLDHSSLWIVADFEKSKFSHSLLLKLMYVFFKMSGSINNGSLPDWNSLLLMRKYKISESTSFYGKFIQCRVYNR